MDLCNQLCSGEKLHEATQMFMRADYGREVASKKFCSVANMDCLSICFSCLKFMQIQDVCL